MNTNDLGPLVRAVIIAGALVGIGIATPSIIAATTDHQRFVVFDRDRQTVLDTRTGQICYPGPRAADVAKAELWRELGRKCDRIELSQ